MPEPVPVFPHHHVPLYRDGGPLFLHAVELAACCALGQRALIVGPPSTGKTTLLRELCQSLSTNHAGLTVHVLLVDQRPEEFADWRMELRSATVHGTSSESGPEEHAAVDSVFERCAAMSAAGQDVLLAIDSLASLARVLNVTHEPSDRVLTGDLLASALMATRQHFGQARAYENAGSLTVIATAAIDTNNELDDVVFHDLVGTGNMEIRLSAEVKEAGLWPPLDIAQSGARREEEILGEQESERRAKLRAMVVQHGPAAGLSLLNEQLARHGSLRQLLIQQSAE